MADTDVLEKSVTKNDYADKTKSGVMQFFISSYGGLGAMPSLPPFWSHDRDLVLMATIYREPVWASAIWKYCTRQIARQWEVESDVPLRARKAQELFLDMDDGRGWVSGMFTHLQAYRLTGSGGWIEIVRATAARGSKIIGLVPLDPLRCTRTGNPSEPIFYRDILGNFHWLKDYQCFNITDQPDTGAMFYRLGHCAAERAYNKILQMEGLERYFLDKLTGRRPSAVHIVNGMRLEQIQEAYRAAEEDANRKGIQSYMGVAIATSPDPTAQLSIVTIPITEVPDGFNPVDERAEAKVVYANCVGIPVQELDPRITAPRALSSNQDLKLQETAEGQNVWEKDWTHATNEHILDNRTTWAFPLLSLHDELLRAQVTGERASAYKTEVEAGAITPAQMAQLLVDENEIPESFLPAGDATDTETLTDEEKPTAEVEAEPESDLLSTEIPQTESNKEKKSLKAHDGAMIALMLDESDSEALLSSLPAGVSPEGDLHITLVYLGKSKDIANLAPIISAIEKTFSTSGFLTGVVGGVGKFNNDEGDGTNAVYASFDCPELNGLQLSLSSLVDDSGVVRANPKEHGFTPHITLTYIPIGEQIPDIDAPKLVITFREVALVVNERKTMFPIGVKKNLAHKSIGGYGRNFSVKLSELVADVLNGTRSKDYLASGLRGLIKSEAKEVYLEGMVDGGFESQAEAEAELDDDDSAAIRDWEFEQLGYVNEFAKAAADTRKFIDEPNWEAEQNKVLARIDLWRNSLEGLGQLGKMSAMKNEIGVWEMGDTEEHCEPSNGKRGCKDLDGEAHRMSWYVKNNINPGTPGSGTACGGYNCRCKIRSRKTGKVIAG